ncbi:DeoR family transcriptional regulator [Clostridia bacterium]|nr:DeoR family transcriptional regulator [Clostridia bacterium]
MTKRNNNVILSTYERCVIMTERHKNILEKLTHSHKIEVMTLAETIGVSPVTMRKDLDILEKRGLIKREHGFAIIGSNDDLGNRLAYQYDEKHQIAQLAAASIMPGETVMIESGSCCALLAEVLVKSRRDVTIITNSAYIAGYVRGDPSAKIVLLGGEYQLESQVMVGPLVSLCAQRFYVDKLFIGTDGILQERGLARSTDYGASQLPAPNFYFTNSNMMRAEAVKAMSRQAQKTIVLTQSQKFSAHGVVPVMHAEDVYAVYTDESIPQEMEENLISRNVQIYKANVQ